MKSDSSLLDLSNKLFRQFLKVYPRPHHDRFNEEMAQDFRDMCEEVLHERGLWGFLDLWMNVGLDLVKTAFEEQFKIRTDPALEKMISLGAISAFLAGATSLLLGCTHASPNWLEWSFRLKWIWIFMGGVVWFALLGFAAYQILNEEKNGLGLWLSLLGAVLMTITGIFMPSDIQIWRLYIYGIDILAIGMIVQSISNIITKYSYRWIVTQFTLGIVMLIFNQLTPPRHMGLLFKWDGTFFASLMGVAWIIFGLVLLHDHEQRKQLYQ